ncbi:MAG: beta-N-acetylhexosaminidase [Pseudomonadota bacterium]
MLERDYGRLFMIGFYGTEFCPELAEFIDSTNPCGVILFGRNIIEPRQVAELNFSMQKFAISKLGRPILIGVDQEGGRVKRLKAPFSEFPPAMDMASGANPNDAIHRFASTTAIELKLVGFNLDFIPVLDVLGENIDLQGTVIGDRSFGSNPMDVGKFGKIVMEVFKSHGLLTCPKHFPGHGAVAIDSHLDLPIDYRPLKTIRQRDLLPFQSVIKNGADIVMTAHVKFADLDQQHPASLSSRIIGGLLRRELQFKGPVATDDLDMGAISKYYSTEEASLLAYQAGSDIMLICNAPEKVFSSRKEIFHSEKQVLHGADRLKNSLVAIDKLFPTVLKLHGHFAMSSVNDYFSSRSAGKA